MADCKRLERLHLEQTLKNAEQAGDKEWAKQIRNELSKLVSSEKKAPAKKIAEVKKSESTDQVAKKGGGD